MKGASRSSAKRSTTRPSAKRSTTLGRRSGSRLSPNAPPSALEWKGGRRGYVEMLDQTLLPAKVKNLRIRDVPNMIAAIRRLSVRGAPAIGVAAGYGVVLGVRDHTSSSSVLRKALKKTARELAASRPTAVNLFWALKRMERAAAECLGRGEKPLEVVDSLLEEARAIHREDRELCECIGRHGATLIEDGFTVLTHCNAGALATGGLGTALAVIYKAAEAGKKVHVFADETRPLLQGARLTSWELSRAGIETTLICDSVAPVALRDGAIHAVVVGADRIAANGDTANKIGTYGLAIQARQHDVPFYVAAPSTTFDLSLASGDAIPIEQRSSDEVTRGFGASTAPEGVGVYNPAFDVTPAKLISAFITEHGIIRRPYRRSIARTIGGR